MVHVAETQAHSITEDWTRAEGEPQQALMMLKETMQSL